MHKEPGLFIRCLIVFQGREVELFTEFVGLKISVTVLDTLKSNLFKILHGGKHLLFKSGYRFRVQKTIIRFVENQNASCLLMGNSDTFLSGRTDNGHRSGPHQWPVGPDLVWTASHPTGIPCGSAT